MALENTSKSLDTQVGWMFSVQHDKQFKNIRLQLTQYIVRGPLVLALTDLLVQRGGLSVVLSQKALGVWE
jgi:hypothetical protein